VNPSPSDGAPPRFSPGIHRFALLTAFCTLMLVTAGGLVTSTGSSLAVPDWPLSFGQVFPRMEGGVLYEHGHRMVATLVGLLVIALMVWVLRKERRAGVRLLALSAFLAVVIQGVLGGITVLMRLPLAVSVGHACLGQIFFCLTVSLALVTSRSWMAPPAPEPGKRGGSPSLASLGLATTGFIFLQLILGALVRHTGSGLAIPDFPLSFGRLIPPVLQGRVLVAYAHRVGALVAGFYVVWTAIRILRRHRSDSLLRRPALVMIALLFLQIALGGLTVLSGLRVIPATAHVVTGALLLATSLVTTLRACQRDGSFRISGAEPAARGQGAPAAPSAQSGWAVR
jgi:cytochrome c oxidase assembly protein subunit 15